MNPDLCGIAVCTDRGGIFEVGDSDVDFSIQSCAKPISCEHPTEPIPAPPSLLCSTSLLRDLPSMSHVTSYHFYVATIWLACVGHDFRYLAACVRYADCIAHQTRGRDTVHSHVGYEPSGQAFNAFSLNRDRLPHNPCINSGAMMVASMLFPHEEPSDRFEQIQEMFNRAAGNVGKVGFDNSTFLSERRCADRNMSLMYFMVSASHFPSTNINRLCESCNQ